MNTFRCVCFLAAVYMTVQQIMRYVEDKDASIVTSKLFNEGPEDKYPSFTVCFTKEPDIIYSGAIHELSVSREDYANLLKGVISQTNNSSETFERIVDLDYNRFVTDWRNHISYLEYRTRNSNDTFSHERPSHGAHQHKRLEVALDNSYQDPDRNCFSRTSSLSSQINSIRENDEVVFDLYPFKLNSNENRGFFQIHIHYPGQFIRDMDKPVHKIPVNTLFRMPGLTNRQSTELSINVRFVSVLKKRSKYQKECNNTLGDDDHEFKLKVIEQVGCIPNYWTSLVTTNSSFRACRKSYQLEQVYRLIANVKSVMSSYDPPCVEMQIPVSVNQQLAQNGLMLNTGDGWKLRLRVSYFTDNFQEIVNVKAFDVETLWSSVGGFIGIFLGYSLLQIPDILDAAWRTSWGIFTVVHWIEYVFALIIPGIIRKRKFAYVALI